MGSPEGGSHGLHAYFRGVAVDVMDKTGITRSIFEVEKVNQRGSIGELTSRNERPAKTLREGQLISPFF
jgi:hypothetical protein